MSTNDKTLTATLKNRPSSLPLSCLTNRVVNVIFTFLNAPPIKQFLGAKYRSVIWEFTYGRDGDIGDQLNVKIIKKRRLNKVHGTNCTFGLLRYLLEARKAFFLADTNHQQDP